MNILVIYFGFIKLNILLTLHLKKKTLTVETSLHDITQTEHQIYILNGQMFKIFK